MEESRAFNLFLTSLIAAVAVMPSLALAEILSAFGIDVPYLCFVIAIVACCAIGGWGLASWALVFSSVGLWFFFLPPTGYGWPQYADAAHLLVFVGVAYFICWIIDGQRRANDELARDNVALGCKITALLNRVKAR